mmetsp:Transcript_27315/g.83855  ORF Transcript_27315/g.83855 Transcript_27315/m.83855 type:complete len:226 (-) Transcript_27315:64-741(-)
MNSSASRISSFSFVKTLDNFLNLSIFLNQLCLPKERIASRISSSNCCNSRIRGSTFPRASSSKVCAFSANISNISRTSTTRRPAATTSSALSLSPFMSSRTSRATLHAAPNNGSTSPLRIRTLRTDNPASKLSCFLTDSFPRRATSASVLAERAPCSLLSSTACAPCSLLSATARASCSLLSSGARFSSSLSSFSVQSAMDLVGRTNQEISFPAPRSASEALGRS